MRQMILTTARVSLCILFLLAAGACSFSPPPMNLNMPQGPLQVSFDPGDGALTVLDRQTNVTWRQRPLPSSMDLVSSKQDPSGRGFAASYRGGDGMLLDLQAAIEPDKPELLLTISSSDQFRAPVVCPGAFMGFSDDCYMVLPLNAGVAWNVDDPGIMYKQFDMNDAHGLCMPFFGMTDGKAAMMAIVQTPDDARVEITRSENGACITPMWLPQHGRWGYQRRIRYVFLPGGHVAIAKRFRQYAAANGLLKTLQQKRQERPSVDKVVGAANVWFFNNEHAVAMASELRDAGMDRILWSAANTPEAVAQLNKVGVLTGRYEILAGAIDPAEVPHVIAPKATDWPEGAWPAGLMRDSRMQVMPGWGVKLDNGRTIRVDQVCNSVIPPIAQRQIAAELKTHAYGARFLDTTAAYGLQECYDPRHPMTRGQDRESRQKLLALLGDRFSLVAGSEDGVACYVPYCDYFEGTLSVFPFRLQDNSALTSIQDPLPRKIAEYQLNERIRIPLWQLVYHDCAVCYWHWDEYNNRAPSAWRKRDLFNALYGTPPMYMFARPYWHEHKQRFIDSYRDTVPLAREVGYSEMTDHRFLTPDRGVQQTSFANGTTVTVNFTANEYRMADGYTLPAEGLRVERKTP